MTDSPKLKRRTLLRGGAALVAGAGMTSWLPPLGAQPRQDQKLIIVLANGGWDPTYALDPKPGAASIDAADGQLRTFGELSVLTHDSRPAVGEFFSRYADRCTIINGLQVRSFVHPDCMKRVLTGSPSESTPDFAAIAAHELAKDLPVPYLALGGQARSGPYASLTGRTGTTNQLAALIDPGAAYPPEGGLLPATGLLPTDDERALVAQYLSTTAQQLRDDADGSALSRQRLDDFLASLQRAQRLRDFARVNGVGERDYTLDLGVQIPLAVRALAEDLSCAALLQTNDWDTHSDNTQQGALHQQLFSTLATLVDALDQAGLSDRAPVVVLSEMGRTPRLNAQGGKDHWPVTSAMLIGGRTPARPVIGATDDELAAHPVDLTSGLPDGDGAQLQAGNFVAGMLQALGIDPDRYVPGVEPLASLLS